MTRFRLVVVLLCGALAIGAALGGTSGVATAQQCEYSENLWGTSNVYICFSHSAYQPPMECQEEICDDPSCDRIGPEYACVRSDLCGYYPVCEDVRCI